MNSVGDGQIVCYGSSLGTNVGSNHSRGIGQSEKRKILNTIGFAQEGTKQKFIRASKKFITQVKILSFSEVFEV